MGNVSRARMGISKWYNWRETEKKNEPYFILQKMISLPLKQKKNR